MKKEVERMIARYEKEGDATYPWEFFRRDLQGLTDDAVLISEDQFVAMITQAVLKGFLAAQIEMKRK